MLHLYDKLVLNQESGIFSRKWYSMDKIQLIKARLGVINEILPKALPDAKTSSIKAMNQLQASREEYTKLYAENFTCALRQILKGTAMDEWKIVDGPSCLHLQDKATRMRIRFLKEFAFIGPIPPAGRNLSRLNAWCQDSLELDRSVDKAKYPLENIELILVWTEAEDRFTCTAYQPLSAGKFPRGASGRAIMKMPLCISGEDFESIRFNNDSYADDMVPKANTIITEQRMMEHR